MKHTFFAIIALLFATGTANAQVEVKKDTTSRKERKEVSISNHGIHIGKHVDSAKKANRKSESTIGLELGINMIQDNTNYSDPSVINYLAGVPASKRNSSLFNQNGGLKPMNVNISYQRSFRLLKTKGQKINVTTGLGMQIYNFRYDNNITYTKDPYTIISDTVKFSKNKLGVNYLNIPLSFTFKTKLHSSVDGKKSTWLVYGFGVSGGYNISAWTKQKSDERGKVKKHGDFEINPFNACATAEFGIDDVIRLYGSYQLTSLYTNGLDQHPVCFGVKLIGI